MAIQIQNIWSWLSKLDLGPTLLQFFFYEKMTNEERFYLQMISSLLSPFYGIMSSTQKEKPSGGFTHQAQLNNVDYAVPDGNSS
jgi:hypothetical protein